MSRALNLSMTEAEVIEHCAGKNIGISALEKLPDGGVRLVCMSSFGAAQIRMKLKSRIMPDNVRRERFRPVSPLW